MRRLCAGVLGLTLLAGQAAAKEPAPPRPTLDWIGFRQLAGGQSELFMLVTQPTQVREVVAGDRIFLILDGVVAGKRNNTRSLDTRWFDTPVAAVTIKKVGKRGCTRCVKSATPTPGMPGAGLFVTVIMKPKAGPSYTTSSEQTDFDPVPPRDPRPGDKPRAKVTRTLIRYGFPRPATEVISPSEDTGRPVLKEPDPKPIKIPPAPKN